MDFLITINKKSNEIDKNIWNISQLTHQQTLIYFLQALMN